MDEDLMPFAPATEVRLLTGVPFDMSYNHTRDFDNISQQQSYFFNFLFYSFDNFTYQREERAIKIPLGYEVARKCNYLMYLNSNYNNKWFYAFVTKVEYVSPQVSRLYIVQDVIQTWMFDFTIVSALIEREHVENDTPGAHTLNEGLELGPIMIKRNPLMTFGDPYTVVAYYLNSSGSEAGGMRDGIFQGLSYSYFPTFTETGVANLKVWLAQMEESNPDGIVAIFTIPAELLPAGPQTAEKKWQLSNAYSDLDGYKPKNNKLFVYPYNYCAINNNIGNENILRFELFQDPGVIEFKLKSVTQINSQAFCIPLNYAGIAEAWDESVVSTAFPQGSWKSDVYTQWLNRNKWSNLGTTINGGLNLISGAASLLMGNVSGATTSFLSAFQSYAQFADRSLFPYQISGQIDADVGNIKWGRWGFTFKHYTITSEYAQVIDGFFHRFGYKVNRNGKPNTKSRTEWNYIKVNEINATGSMPQDHLERIKQCYVNGITFWHTDDIGDYTKFNPISGGGVG